MEELNRESLSYDKSTSFAIIVGLTFMVVFRLIGYLATKPPKVASLGKQGFCIVVLGDVGHSPRMLLHARSALDAGWRVDVIGYKGKRVQNLIYSADPLDRPTSDWHGLRFGAFSDMDIDSIGYYRFTLA